MTGKTDSPMEGQDRSRMMTASLSPTPNTIVSVSFSYQTIVLGVGDREKERCSGSYRQAVRFLVIKDDSISKRPS